MRRLIEGDSRIAKAGAVSKIHGLCKGPIKDKLAAVVQKKKAHDEALQQGAKMSGMNSFLPGMNEREGMDHQRAKLGEISPKKKKEEDEE